MDDIGDMNIVPSISIAKKNALAKNLNKGL